MTQLLIAVDDYDDRLSTMPTSVTILTILGLAMQVPAIALGIVLMAAGKQSGPHAGNAALALAIPFVIALAIAVIGGLFTLGTGMWSLTSDLGRATAWGWVRWSSVTVLMFWLITLLLFLMRR
jgi:hypothetical protein